MKVYLAGLNISKCHICMLLPFAEIMFKLRDMGKKNNLCLIIALTYILCPFDFISPQGYFCIGSPLCARETKASTVGLCSCVTCQCTKKVPVREINEMYCECFFLFSL